MRTGPSADTEDCGGALPVPGRACKGAVPSSMETPCWPVPGPAASLPFRWPALVGRPPSKLGGLATGCRRRTSQSQALGGLGLLLVMFLCKGSSLHGGHSPFPGPYQARGKPRWPSAQSQGNRSSPWAQVVTPRTPEGVLGAPRLLPKDRLSGNPGPVAGPGVSRRVSQPAARITARDPRSRAALRAAGCSPPRGRRRPSGLTRPEDLAELVEGHLLMALAASGARAQARAPTNPWRGPAACAPGPEDCGGAVGGPGPQPLARKRHPDGWPPARPSIHPGSL